MGFKGLKKEGIEPLGQNIYNLIDPRDLYRFRYISKSLEFGTELETKYRISIYKKIRHFKACVSQEEDIITFREEEINQKEWQLFEEKLISPFEKINSMTKEPQFPKMFGETDSPDCQRHHIPIDDAL
ncbi:MAG: hypothetical protein H8D87_20345 [Deltaproteobacteria bacterium]|uniref:hypothetical protein n=1 Tax=Desulfobacula sp. TaxID=2593537 RepID=UPI0019A24C3D|nr:hypothetical protein [Candidatus Desulfobacula maris]MBL6992307.1 hypothetical protein [Desulfobacula sp.]